MKPLDRAYRLGDGRGLSLVVQPSGSKLWRFKYRRDDKQTTLHIGAWPKVGLIEARERCEAARKMIADGGDPVVAKKFGPAAAKVRVVCGNSFRDVAAEWIEKCERDGLSQVTINKTRWLLDKAYPDIGALPIEVIRPRDALAVLKKVEAQGMLETARRLRSVLSRVFRYAVAISRIERDPAADLRGASATPKTTNLTAITTERQAAQLIKAIDRYPTASRDALLQQGWFAEDEIEIVD